jgi:hypothetical protein
MVGPPSCTRVQDGVFFVRSKDVARSRHSLNNNLKGSGDVVFRRIIRWSGRHLAHECRMAFLFYEDKF